MATTSYSTDGAPVPAAATYPNADAGSVGRGAIGAGAAQSAQESTTDAEAFGGARMPVLGANGSRVGFGCGWVCIVVVGLVVIALAASSGGGGAA